MPPANFMGAVLARARSPNRASDGIMTEARENLATTCKALWTSGWPKHCSRAAQRLLAAFGTQTCPRLLHERTQLPLHRHCLEVSNQMRPPPSTAPLLLPRPVARLRSRPRKRKQARGRAKNQGKDRGHNRSPMAPAPHWSGGFFPRDIGYVLVDVRRSGEVDPRVQVTLQMLVFAHNVRAANSSAQEGGWAGQDGSGTALWVGASMVPKVPPLVRQLAMVRSLPEGVNPLIGKAHALLHSPFNISVLVDGDSWICVGWLPRLQARLSLAPLPQPRPSVTPISSATPPPSFAHDPSSSSLPPPTSLLILLPPPALMMPICLQARFGADFDVAWTKATVRLGYHRRTDTAYLAGLRGPDKTSAMVQWSNFDERNTGTVVVV